MIPQGIYVIDSMRQIELTYLIFFFLKKKGRGREIFSKADSRLV